MAGKRPYNAADHVRTDWTFAEVSDFLDARARGYSGQLREILCTAAAQLRRAGPIVQEHDVAKREEDGS